MRTRFALIKLAALTALLVASSFASAKGPTPLPPLEGGKSSLQVRIVRYQGGTNGEMVVEVQNTGTRTETFSAQGLYFVPEGDPDKAPQRLGAAGPFQVEGKAEARPLEKLAIAPKAKAQLRLQVFCIDSHRSSPSSQNAFRLGKDRMPKQLRTEIDAKAKAALGRHGNAMPAAKSAIQSEVWNTRNKKWIQLDGERKNEQSSNNVRPSPNSRIYRHPSRIQEQRREPAPQFAQPPAPAPQQQRIE